MELGPVTKLDKRNKIKLLSFFGFRANLEQSGSWIPEAWSLKLTFSSIGAFYLIKTENRIEKSLIQLSHYCFD